VIIVVTDEAKQESVPADILDFDQLCSDETAPIAAGVCIPRDLAALIYTSGSTRQTQGRDVELRTGSRGRFDRIAEYLEITAADRILAVLPFSFDAGMNQLTTSIQQGSALVIANWVFGRDIVRLLERERITGLAGVPAL